VSFRLLRETCQDAPKLASVLRMTKAEVGALKLFRKRHFILSAAGVTLAAGFAVLAYNRAGDDIPDIAVLQSAYDSEANSAAAGHDANLLVIDVVCKPRQQLGMFLCVVAFTDRRDPDRQLSYDIAEVAAESSKWHLKSGLCKR
jgi:hypothetical protein